MDTQATITGTLTADPEARFTPAGTAVTSFSVAVNKRVKNDDGKWEDGATSFFNVVCWKTLAENVAESLEKGQRVIVTGRLEQKSWETKDGERRSTIELVADEVGPSLRWATCEVAKTERRATSPTAPPAPAYDPGEEPF